MAENFRPRKVIITINYHYTAPGRRVGLRADIAEAVKATIVRRIMRSGIISVDSVEVREV